MAAKLYASNISAAEGKWNPYYYKPFNLGSNLVTAEDGLTYVRRHDKTGGITPAISACQTSDHNCAYSYRLEFTTATVDKFTVKKYYKAPTWRDGSYVGDEIDEIIASGTPGVNEHEWLATTDGPIYIDIGVKVTFNSETSFTSSHVYQIDTATREDMEKKKIWHGGYSTWLRLPENEGKSYKTDIIPMVLINRNLSFLINQGSDNSAIALGSAIGCFSAEDTTTNARVSVSLEWSVNKDAVNQSTAMSTANDFVAHHGWVHGTEFADDLSLVNFTDLTDMYFSSPAGDTQGSGSTGTTQGYNGGVSGRAGYARVVFQHKSDAIAHNDAELARNQFFPIILLIS